MVDLIPDKAHNYSLCFSLIYFDTEIVKIRIFIIKSYFLSTYATVLG